MKEIALHILDLAQNSIEAGATRVRIAVSVNRAAGTLTVEIADNGRGMPPEKLRAVTDPFVTSRRTRRVGLGLPLFAATARQTGGNLSVTSAEGEGTRVTAVMGLGHIDRPPLGDLAVTLTCLLAGNPDLGLEFRFRCDGKEFSFTAADLRSRLEGVSLANPEVFRFVREWVDAQIRELLGPGDPGPDVAGTGEMGEARTSVDNAGLTDANDAIVDRVRLSL